MKKRCLWVCLVLGLFSSSVYSDDSMPPEIPEDLADDTEVIDPLREMKNSRGSARDSEEDMKKVSDRAKKYKETPPKPKKKKMKAKKKKVEKKSKKVKKSKKRSKKASK